MSAQGNAGYLLPVMGCKVLSWFMVPEEPEEPEKPEIPKCANVQNVGAACVPTVTRRCFM